MPPPNEIEFSSAEDYKPVIEIYLIRERVGRIEEFKDLMKDRLRAYDVQFRWTIGLMLAGFIGLASLIITLWGAIQNSLAKIPTP